MTTVQVTPAAIAASVTSNFIVSKEQFQLVKATWCSNPTHSAADIVTYNLLRGFPADRGFTPISETNPHKISSNSNDAWFGFNHAKNIAYGNVMVATNRWRSEEDNKAITERHTQQFKEKFGIELTEELRAAIRIMSLEKLHG